MTLEAGHTLGRYRIVAPLGAGGMGEVYRAEDTRLGRQVALKILPSGSRQDPDVLARFSREARAVAALSHPNILSIFDVGEQDGEAYAVTELLEGETLRERLRRGPLPDAEATTLAHEALDGLAAAHERGIVHRDIKPENLFLARGGLKILDFGIARILPAAGPDAPTAEVWKTETGLIVGTAAYMAPEQIAGRPVDARADLFALGCVLFEALTGRHPFGDGTPMAIVARILRDPAPVEQVPEAFRDLVRRLLEKDPDRRFQSARAARAALPTPIPPPPRRANRTTTVALAIAVILLMATLVVIWPRLRSDTRRPITAVAVLPLVNLSGDPAQEYFADGMTEAIISDLAQIASLKVISRTSVMRYKDARKAVPEIAAELGVTGIIEGSLRRAADRVIVTANLIDASRDEHLWTRSYERNLVDVLELQSEIARAIAHEVRAAVTPAEAGRLRARGQVSPEAYELYLRGRFEWNWRTPGSLARAVESFQASIDRDPGYAPAWAGLADARALLRQVSTQPDGGTPVTVAAARKAVELDPELAEAHASLGFALFSLAREWEPAGEALRRAVALNPGYASARQWLGAWLFLMDRRDEGLRELQQAVTLDPLAPRIRSVHGMYLYFAGRDDEARMALTASAEEDPQAHMFLADLALAAGDSEQAFIHARLAPAERRLGTIAVVHATLGQRAEAERILSAAPPETLPPQILARLHTALGRPGEGVAALLRDPEGVYLPYVVGHPDLAPLRAHPGYREFLQAVNLEPAPRPDGR